MPVGKNQRQSLFSKYPQSDYETATATGSLANWRRLIVTDANVTNLTPNESDNRNDAHGFDEATEDYLLSWDNEAQKEIALSSEDAPFLFKGICGGLVSTAEQTQPSVYHHVPQWLDFESSRQLPAYSLIDIIGTALNKISPSMLFKSLRLSGNGLDRIQCSFGLKGSGKETMPSGISVAQGKTLLPSGLHYFTNAQATVKIADETTLNNLVDYGTAKRLNTWEFGIENEFIEDEAKRPGAGKFQTANDRTSGAVSAELLLARRNRTGGMVVRLNNQSEELAALKARKYLDWKLVLTGGQIGTTGINHTLSIQAPRMKYKTVVIDNSGELTTLQITPVFRFNPSTGEIVNIEIINDQPGTVYTSA